MKILIALDSFKGCLSSHEAGRELAMGIRLVKPRLETEVLAVADGGEGTADILGNANDASVVWCETIDPLGRPTRASYRLATTLSTAFIDMAAASGLPLLKPEERSALDTSSYGTGLMIADAITHGARNVVLGLGGSATVDAGAGILQALGIKFYDADNNLMREHITGRALPGISRIDVSDFILFRNNISLTPVCDVESPFMGPDGAVARFAPQKGADSAAMDRLEQGFGHMRELFRNTVGIDINRISGGGAAGGAGATLAALTGSRIRRGAEVVLHEINFDAAIQPCRIVITGEGKADITTLSGKIPSLILHRGLREQIPVYLVCGLLSDTEQLSQAGYARLININRQPGMISSDADNPLNEMTARARLRAAGARIGAAINPAIFGF